jgi:PTS system mannose-specific IIA component
MWSGRRRACAPSASGPRTTWKSAGATSSPRRATSAGDVDEGQGVILLTDMFGGTPSNLAISVMEQTHAEVIAGLNLPMLIKLASVRSRLDLQSCVAHAQEAGRKYISVASYLLAGEK